MSYKDDLTYKISTYNGPRLVALQYQAIIENLKEIKNMMSDKIIQKDKIDSLLNKNRDIFSNLMVPLDEDNEFNNKTKMLYTYIVKRTDDALINNSKDIIDEILPLLTSTMKAWEEVANRDKDPNNDISVGATYGRNDVNVYTSKNEWKG